MVGKFTRILILISLPLLGHPQAPLNWVLDEINPGEDLTVTPDETTFTAGARSLKAVLISGEAPYLVSSEYSVVPGTAYDFSINVLDQDTNGQVKIYADFYDIQGNDVFGKDPVFSPDDAEWQNISWSGIVPSNAVKGYVMVKFYCQPDFYHFDVPSTIWIDNARFALQGGDNLVVNGSFEEWSLSNDDNSRTEPVRLYPNPVTDYLVVEIAIPLERMVVTDLTGQNKLSQKIDGQRKIRVETRQLPKGVYMVAFYSENGVVLNRKLIKY